MFVGENVISQVGLHAGARGEHGAAFGLGIHVVEERAMLNLEMEEIREVRVFSIQGTATITAGVVLAVIDKGAVRDRARQGAVDGNRAARLGDGAGDGVLMEEAVFNDEFAFEDINGTAVLAGGISTEFAITGSERATGFHGNGTAIGRGGPVFQRQLFERETGGIGNREDPGDPLAGDRELIHTGADDVEVFGDVKRPFKRDDHGEIGGGEIEDHHVAIACEVDRLAQGAGAAVRSARDDVRHVAVADEDGEEPDGGVGGVFGREGEGGEARLVGGENVTGIEGVNEVPEGIADICRRAGHGIGACTGPGEVGGAERAFRRIVEGDGEGDVFLVSDIKSGKRHRHAIARLRDGEWLLAERRQP